MMWRGTPSFKLKAESKETKLWKKQWYVAHALHITLIYYYFFHWKIEGSRSGGPGFVYTHYELEISVEQ